jgi:hypothetical protein
MIDFTVFGFWQMVIGWVLLIVSSFTLIALVVWCDDDKTLLDGRICFMVCITLVCVSQVFVGLAITWTRIYFMGF